MLKFVKSQNRTKPVAALGVPGRSPGLLLSLQRRDPPASDRRQSDRMDGLGSDAGRRFAVGSATFTPAETGILAGASTVITAAIVTGSFELGVGIGSMINAAIWPCDEKPDPCP